MHHLCPTSAKPEPQNKSLKRLLNRPNPTTSDLASYKLSPASPDHSTQLARIYSPSPIHKYLAVLAKVEMKGVVATLLAALVVAQLVAEPVRAFTCVDVDMSLAPCVTYITGQQSAPAAGCCDGVRRLKALAATQPDRRFACGCVKQAAQRFQNLKDYAVNSLPRICGAPVPFPISMQVDCGRIP